MRAGGTALVDAAPVVGVDGGDLQPVVREGVVVHVPDRLGGFAPGQPDSARRRDVQPVQVKTRQPALAVPGVPQLDVALDQATGVAVAHGREHQLVLLYGADLKVRHGGHAGAQPCAGRPAGDQGVRVVPRGGHDAPPGDPVGHQLRAAQARYVHESGYGGVAEFLDDRVDAGRGGVEPDDPYPGSGLRTTSADENGHLVLLDRRGAVQALGDLLPRDLYGLLARGHRVEAVPVGRDHAGAEVIVG